MAVRSGAHIGMPTGTVARRTTRESDLPRLLESNEARLDRLQQRGAQIRVDGTAFLLAFFERVRLQPSTRDNRLEWGRWVEGLLDELETPHMALR